jgi:hypothetical protein
MKKILATTILMSLFCTNVFGFDLYCRGPLQISSGTRGRIAKFKKAAVKAGLDGSGLAAGECAWGDRPIRANEPSEMDYDMVYQTAEYVPPDVGEHDPLPLMSFRYYMDRQNAIESTQELTGYYSRRDIVTAVDVINNPAFLAFTSNHYPRFQLKIMGAKP